MHDATVLVTGGTSGIGLATATALAGMGARVGVVGRDPQRARDAVRRISETHPAARVDLFVADVSSQHEVRRLASDVLAAYPRIGVLVNNVGGYWSHRHLTVDGIERTLAVNHLAPYLLTRLLLARLLASAPARVVTVSSGAHSMGRIDLGDLSGERGYSGQRAYSQSKLANVLFAYELARRLKGTGVTSNAVHPGVVNTSFGADDSTALMTALRPLARVFMTSPERGARTSVWLASAPELADVSGVYAVNGKPRRSARASYDEALARRLWDVSAQLTDLPPTVR
jgi:NAD(P)-dependent dehydrogenase (short-subunit alcohol dehydrogenase family)